jgi:hypothetical protein
MSQVISFCGGKQSEVVKLISAYNDMENYYRTNLDSENDFDQREFSKFAELQNTSIKEALVMNKFDLNDFSKWVIKGNIDTAMNVRKLPKILRNAEALKVFLKSNITEAWNTLTVEEAEVTSLKNVPYDVLAEALANKLANIELKEVEKLKNDPRYDDKKNSLGSAFNELEWVLKYIEKD